MPKIAKVLTPVEVNRIQRPGWHAVGGVAGLLLQVKEPTGESKVKPRSWILRVRVGDTRDPIGLGPYPQVSLAEAREKAKKLVEDARRGINLLEQKRASRSALLVTASTSKTFRQCAEEYMKTHAKEYRSEKHRKQWNSSLEAYAYPVIGNILAADITMRHVLNVVQQDSSTTEAGKKIDFWHDKTETARRVLGRIKTVLDYATVSEYRTGANPAQWKGFLDTQLPSPKKISPVKHYPAVPYPVVGNYMEKLRANRSTSAKALEFLILTAVRSGSVREATWSEIDFDRALWIIPPEHTKRFQEHRVPLSRQAVALLQSLPTFADTPLIFPGAQKAALTDMALSELMRGMHERGEVSVIAVPHGFRSTFRDWAAETTDYPFEIRKVATGHPVGDAVQQAYQRTDLLEKRRCLMQDWANYLDIKST